MTLPQCTACWDPKQPPPPLFINALHKQCQRRKLTSSSQTIFRRRQEKKPTQPSPEPHSPPARGSVCSLPLGCAVTLRVCSDCPDCTETLRFTHALEHVCLSQNHFFSSGAAAAADLCPLLLMSSKYEWDVLSWWQEEKEEEGMSVDISENGGHSHLPPSGRWRCCLLFLSVQLFSTSPSFFSSPASFFFLSTADISYSLYRCHHRKKESLTIACGECRVQIWALCLRCSFVDAHACRPMKPRSQVCAEKTKKIKNCLFFDRKAAGNVDLLLVSERAWECAALGSGELFTRWMVGAWVSLLSSQWHHLRLNTLHACISSWGHGVWEMLAFARRGESNDQKFTLFSPFMFLMASMSCVS